MILPWNKYNRQAAVIEHILDEYYYQAGYSDSGCRNLHCNTSFQPPQETLVRFSSIVQNAGVSTLSIKLKEGVGGPTENTSLFFQGTGQLADITKTFP